MDDDDDGYFDIWEIFLETDPEDNTSRPLDTDNDGIPNGDINNSKNWMDLDDDNDGFTDREELNDGTDPLNKNDYPVKDKIMINNFLFSFIMFIIILIITIFFIFKTLNFKKKIKKDKMKRRIDKNSKSYRKDND